MRPGLEYQNIDVAFQPKKSSKKIVWVFVSEPGVTWNFPAYKLKSNQVILGITYAVVKWEISQQL